MALVIVGPRVGSIRRPSCRPIVRKSPLLLQPWPIVRGQVRQRPRHVAAAKQQVGRPERARGEHDDARRIGHGHEPAGLDPVGPDAIEVPLALDGTDHVERPDLGAVVLGPRQVVEVERVAGEDGAADVALPEVDAGPLLDPLGIGEAPRPGRVEPGIRDRVPARVEVDRELERTEPVGLAGRGRRLVHQRRPGRPLPARHGLDVHHPADRRVVRRELLVGDLRRPARLERVGCRLDADVRVDERSAADRRSLGDRHRAEDPEVDPAVLALRMAVVPAPRVARLAREVGRGPAPAALEHEHAVAGLREAARGHRPAEPGADDDRVVRGHGHADGAPGSR